MSSSGIVLPEFVTAQSTRAGTVPFSRQPRTATSPPEGVNFSAFSSTFVSARSSLSGSTPRISASCDTSTLTSTPRARAAGSMRRTQRATT